MLRAIAKGIQKLRSRVPGSSDGWLAFTKDLERSVTASESNARLRQVATPGRLRYSAIRTTIASRNADYRLVGRMADLYYRLFIVRHAPTLFSVMCEQLLRPRKPDRAYEFAVLFEVLAALERWRRTAGGTRTVALIRAGHDTVFRYRFPTRTVEVSFQHTPDDLASSSKYALLCRTYRLHPGPLIPDIVIGSTGAPGTQRYALIEVKMSSDRSYIGDGIKTVLAYLDCFRAALANVPKALLVIWSKIPPQTIWNRDDEVWITDARNLAVCVERFLEQVMHNQVDNPVATTANV